jgi:sec-independent protein translocase protein TatC
MSNGAPLKDPDDFFADTRMSFGDHIEDLRTHLWRAIVGFLLAMLVSFFFGHKVLAFITAPVKAELNKFYVRHAQKVIEKLDQENGKEINQPSPYRYVAIPGKHFREAVKAAMEGKPFKPLSELKRPVVVRSEEEGESEANLFTRLFGNKGEDRQPLKEGEEAHVPGDDVYLPLSDQDPLHREADKQAYTILLNGLNEMATMSVLEAFMVWIKVCMLCGLVLGSPWIFWQLWSFVAAGLYPHEKKYVHVYLPFSLGLFLAGVFLCELFVIPRAIEALLWFNEWLGLKPDLRLNEWLSFAILMPLVFGLAFQTPLVMLFLERIGIMTVDSFRRYRRMCWFAMALFAMVFTPSPDAFSMLLMWVPMVLLFELGIILCRVSPRKSAFEDAPETNELVEV